MFVTKLKVVATRLQTKMCFQLIVSGDEIEGRLQADNALQLLFISQVRDDLMPDQMPASPPSSFVFLDGCFFTRLGALGFELRGGVMHQT